MDLDDAGRCIGLNLADPVDHLARKFVDGFCVRRVLAFEHDGPIPRGLLVYTPYIWVDTSPAAIGGRLVFGFPKHVATLTMPQRALDPARFQVDGWGVVAEGGRGEELPLLWIARRDRPGGRSLLDRWSSRWDGSHALFDGHESMLAHLVNGLAAVPDWLGLRKLFGELLVRNHWLITPHACKLAIYLRR